MAPFKMKATMPVNKADEGLKRVVGAPALAMSIVNGTIGAGIFAFQDILCRPGRVNNKGRISLPA